MLDKVYGHRSLSLFLFRDQLGIPRESNVNSSVDSRRGPVGVRVMTLIDKLPYHPAIAANVMRQRVLPCPWLEASKTQP